MLVQTCSIPPNGADSCTEARAQMIAERLASSIEGLQRSLESLDQGVWQVLSHDVLDTGDSLVVSFLIFRQPRGKL